MKVEQLTNVNLAIEDLFSTNKYGTSDILEIVDLMVEFEKFTQDITGPFYKKIQKKEEGVIRIEP